MSAAVMSSKLAGLALIGVTGLDSATFTNTVPPTPAPTVGKPGSAGRSCQVQMQLTSCGVTTADLVRSARENSLSVREYHVRCVQCIDSVTGHPTISTPIFGDNQRGFSQDSPVCLAAYHTFGDDGGQFSVSVHKDTSRQPFKGSTNNGIQSRPSTATAFFIRIKAEVCDWAPEFGGRKWV